MIAGISSALLRAARRCSAPYLLLLSGCTMRPLQDEDGLAAKKLRPCITRIHLLAPNPCVCRRCGRCRMRTAWRGRQMRTRGTLAARVAAAAGAVV